MKTKILCLLTLSTLLFSMFFAKLAQSALAKLEQTTPTNDSVQPFPADMTERTDGNIRKTEGYAQN